LSDRPVFNQDCRYLSRDIRTGNTGNYRSGLMNYFAEMTLNI
jgi:hypothetical protein